MFTNMIVIDAHVQQYDDATDAVVADTVNLHFLPLISRARYGNLFDHATLMRGLEPLPAHVHRYSIASSLLYFEIAFCNCRLMIA